MLLRYDKQPAYSSFSSLFTNKMYIEHYSFKQHNLQPKILLQTRLTAFIELRRSNYIYFSVPSL